MYFKFNFYLASIDLNSFLKTESKNTLYLYLIHLVKLFINNPLFFCS